MYFWWICGEEGDLHVLLLCHLKALPDKLFSESEKSEGKFEFCRTLEMVLIQFVMFVTVEKAVFHFKLSWRQGLFFFFLLLTTVSGYCFATHLTASNVIFRIHGPWTRRISSGGSGRDWLQSISGRKKEGWIYGDRKVRDENLNVIFYFMWYKKTLPIIHIFLCNVVT